MILLVWIFVMRISMIVASIGSYLVNEAITRARHKTSDKMDFERPLTSLVWLTSVVSIGLTFLISYALLGNGDADRFIAVALDSYERVRGGGSAVLDHSSWGLWWKLAVIISCGTLAGAIIPEAVKAFTSTNSRHVRETVTASRQGGASLNILAIGKLDDMYWI